MLIGTTEDTPAMTLSPASHWLCATTGSWALPDRLWSDPPAEGNRINAAGDRATVGTGETSKGSDTAAGGSRIPQWTFGWWKNSTSFPNLSLFSNTRPTIFSRYWPGSAFVASQSTRSGIP